MWPNVDLPVFGVATFVLIWSEFAAFEYGEFWMIWGPSIALLVGGTWVFCKTKVRCITQAVSSLFRRCSVSVIADPPYR